MELRFDTIVPLAQDATHGHNRWHPDIAPIAHVVPGEQITLDTRDGIDGQIGPESGPADVLSLDLRRGHPLTGPLYVEGAQPGDVLEIEMLAIDPAPFGFTVVRPGAGPLGDLIEQPLVVHWRIGAGFARSADLPGVRIRGSPFMGVIGVAPSRERLRELARREGELHERGGVVMPPDPHGAVPAADETAAAGLRTVPPRETGGNLDVKQLTVGSRLLLAVDVPGALVSVGDAHFAQGDGEICSQAIEMRATVRLRLGLRKRGSLTWRPRNPVVEYSEPPSERARSRLMTTGIPVDDGGANHDRDLGVAARAALLEMIGYLRTAHGLTFAQACALCSVAVDLRISEMVNTPNVLVSASLPMDVFDEGHDNSR